MQFSLFCITKGLISVAKFVCHCQIDVVACFPPLSTDKTVGHFKNTILKTLKTYLRLRLSLKLIIVLFLFFIFYFLFYY